MRDCLANVVTVATVTFWSIAMGIILHVCLSCFGFADACGIAARGIFRSPQRVHAAVRTALPGACSMERPNVPASLVFVFPPSH